MRAKTDTPDTRELSAALVASYRAADPSYIAAGSDWYPAARREVRRLADLAPAGIGPVRVAAIVAALSPRAHWSVNLRWAEVLVRAASYGDPCPAVSTLGNRAKAWAIVQGADPDRELSGPKVRRFWRNLCGDDSAVTLDTWAIRPVGWGPRELSRRGWYEALEAAYREAARELSRPPATLQAELWMALRGVKPTDPHGFRPAAVKG